MWSGILAWIGIFLSLITFCLTLWLNREHEDKRKKIGNWLKSISTIVECLALLSTAGAVICFSNMDVTVRGNNNTISLIFEEGKNTYTSNDSDFKPKTIADMIISNYDNSTAIFSVDTKVRLVGGNWQDELVVCNDDVIEIQIEYKNISYETQKGVCAVVSLPEHVSLINDSTLLYNASYSDGVICVENSICNTGINIGSYTSGSNAYIRMKCIVHDLEQKGQYRLNVRTAVSVNNTSQSEKVVLLARI